VESFLDLGALSVHIYADSAMNVLEGSHAYASAPGIDVAFGANQWSDISAERFRQSKIFVGDQSQTRLASPACAPPDAERCLWIMNKSRI